MDKENNGRVYHEKLNDLTITCLKRWKLSKLCSCVPGHAKYRSVIREKVVRSTIYNRQLNRNKKNHYILH